jgi:hypothetical protein
LRFPNYRLGERARQGIADEHLKLFGPKVVLRWFRIGDPEVLDPRWGGDFAIAYHPRRASSASCGPLDCRVDVGQEALGVSTPHPAQDLPGREPTAALVVCVRASPSLLAAMAERAVAMAAGATLGAVR